MPRVEPASALPVNSGPSGKGIDFQVRDYLTMPHFKPEWTEQQGRRFMRPDAHRWIRPDAHRWLRPDYKRFLQPGAVQWPLLPLLEGKANFNPNQLRVPKGNSEGGQWTDESGGAEHGFEGDLRLFGDAARPEGPATSPVRLAQLDKILDDAGRPYYNPGGHHENPQQNYKRWKNLRPEVRKIFEKATAGTVPKMAIRYSIDGEPQGHFWKGKDSPHGQYNEAVMQLSDKFFERHGIDEFGGNMTVQHAYDLLREIRNSEDPRIRNYNNMVRLLRRLGPLRTGRGTE